MSLEENKTALGKEGEEILPDGHTGTPPDFAGAQF